LHFIKFIKR